MLPSKKFFVHAALILLVGAVWFAVVEQQRSRLEFEGNLVSVDETTEQQELTEEEIDAIIDQLIESIDREIALGERETEPVALLEDTVGTDGVALITSNELTLLYTPTEDEIRQYGNAVAGVIKEAFSSLHEDEIQTFYRLVESKDTSLAGTLAARERAYTKAALTLRNIPVPTSAAFTHIQIANIFLDLGEALTQMQRVFENPQDAVSAGRFFEVRSSSLADQFLVLNEYFSSRGIVFGEDEQTSVRIFETN